jgi:hypothetical protein
MDTLQQHQKNLLDALEAVSRFGWLTRDQITRILWPGSTPATREKLGQRLLGKAQEKACCCVGSSTVAAPPMCCAQPE